MSHLWKILPMPDFALRQPHELEANPNVGKPNPLNLAQSQHERFPSHQPFTPAHPAMLLMDPTSARKKFTIETMATDRHFHRQSYLAAIADDTQKRILARELQNDFELRLFLRRLDMTRYLQADRMYRDLIFENAKRSALQQTETLAMSHSRERWRDFLYEERLKTATKYAKYFEQNDEKNKAIRPVSWSAGLKQTPETLIAAQLDDQISLTLMHLRQSVAASALEIYRMVGHPSPLPPHYSATDAADTPAGPKSVKGNLAKKT